MKADAVYILDHTALEALWGFRAGGETLQEILERAGNHHVEMYVTSIDLGKAYRTLLQAQDKKTARVTLEKLEEGPINTVVINKKIALEAMDLALVYRLEYDEAFACALGVITAGTLVSANPALEVVQDELDLLRLPDNPKK